LQVAQASSGLKNDVAKDWDGQELIGPFRFRKDAWINEIGADKSLNLTASHITDPFAQCRLVAAMTKRNMDQLLSRSGPETPTTYAQLYLAHVLGRDCATRLLKASADGQMPIDQALAAGFADKIGKVDLDQIKKQFDKLFHTASGAYNTLAGVTKALGDQLNTTIDRVQQLFVDFYELRPDWKPSDSTKPPAGDANTKLGAGISGGPLQALFNSVVIKLAPSPKPKEFRDALTSDRGWGTLTKYGITAHQRILQGYLATVLMESGQLREFKESGRYVDNANGTAIGKLKNAFARMRKYSDSELQQYANLHDDNVEEMKRFFNFAYCDSYSKQPNELGNRKGTDDGYYFRGGGYTQVTGRDSYIKYGKMCEPIIDFSVGPPYPGIDDPNQLLVLSAAEWKAYGCNERMMADDFDDVQRRINAGLNGSLSAVNDPDSRRKWWATVKREFARGAAQSGSSSTS
jgi:predicted chitinase